MCPRDLNWLQQVAETLKAKRVDQKHSEVLLAYPKVAVRFYLTHILIAIIAFLWDALV